MSPSRSCASSRRPVRAPPPGVLSSEVDGNRRHQHRGTRQGAAPCAAGRPWRLHLPRREVEGALRRQGALDPQARGRPLLEARCPRGGRHGRPDRRHRVHRDRDRGRGAARRAGVHQALPAALQRPPARRQVLSLHRRQPRRGVSAHLLHARAAPARACLLRAVLEREARARDTRPARQGLPVPHLRRPGARPREREPLSRLPHPPLPGALRRLHLEGGVSRERRDDHRLPVGPLPPDRAGARPGDEEAPRPSRSSSRPRSTATS